MKRRRDDTRLSFPYTDLFPELQAMVRDACTASARLMLVMTCRTEHALYPEKVCYGNEWIRPWNAYELMAKHEPVSLGNSVWGSWALLTRQLEYASGPRCPLAEALAYNGEEAFLRRVIRSLVSKYSLRYVVNEYHRLKHLAIFGGHTDMALRLIDDCVGEGRGACPACLFYVCMMPHDRAATHCAKIMTRLTSWDYDEDIYDQWVWQRETLVPTNHSRSLFMRLNQLASVSAIFSGNRLLVQWLVQRGLFDGAAILDTATRYLKKCHDNDTLYVIISSLRWPVDTIDAMIHWTEQYCMVDYPLPHLWRLWLRRANAVARIVQGRDLLSVHAWQLLPVDHFPSVLRTRGLSIFIATIINLPSPENREIMRAFCWETLPRLLVHDPINALEPTLAQACIAGLRHALRCTNDFVPSVQDACRAAIRSPTVCTLLSRE